MNTTNILKRLLPAIILIAIIAVLIPATPGYSKNIVSNSVKLSDTGNVYTFSDADITLNVNTKTNTSGKTVPIDGTAISSSADIRTSVIAKAVEQLGGNFDLNIIVSTSEETYKIFLHTADLFSGQALKLFETTGASSESEYIILDSPSYTISADGKLRVNLESGRTYRMALSKTYESIVDKIKATVKAKEKEKHIAVDGTYKMSLASGANTASIKTISYTSSDNRAAIVDENGKVTGKTIGDSTITGTITYNNGSTSEIHTLIHVERDQKRADELNKKINPIKVKSSSYTLKVASKNNKTTQNATISAKEITKNVTKAKGKVSFKKEAGNSKIKISSTGKITIKKGIASSKSGKNYLFDVRVKAHGNKTYQKAEKIMTIKIKVKAN